MSAKTRITQAQVDAPPRVDSRLALRRPLGLRLPRSAPRSGHETPAQSAPEPQSPASAAHPFQPRDLRSQHSRNDGPGRSNHIEHDDQQQTDDPHLEVRNVSLRGVMLQRPIQFVSEVRSRQWRLLDWHRRHPMSPVVARSPRPLKDSRAARTILSTDNVRTTPPSPPSPPQRPRIPPPSSRRPQPAPSSNHRSGRTLPPRSSLHPKPTIHAPFSNHQPPTTWHLSSGGVHFPGKSSNPLPNALRLARASTVPAPATHPPRSARRAPVHPPIHSRRACQATFPIPGACAEPPASPPPPRPSGAAPRPHLPWPQLPAALSLAPEPCKLAPENAPKPTPAGPASPLGKPGRRACVPPKGPVPGRCRLVMPLETSTRSRLLAHRPQP